MFKTQSPGNMCGFFGVSSVVLARLANYFNGFDMFGIGGPLFLTALFCSILTAVYAVWFLRKRRLEPTLPGLIAMRVGVGAGLLGLLFAFGA